MHPLVVYDPMNGIFTVPGSEVYITVDPSDYYYANAPRDYRGYYFHADAESWSEPQCLDPDELNFYLSSNGIDYMIDDNWPGNLDLIYVNVRDELLFLEDAYEEVHFLDLTFGETYQTLVPPSGL